MSLNPHMKVYITHGVFDLVTPFFTAERLSNLMKLTDEQKSRLTVKHYAGGHMFYTWNESRTSFFSDMKEFYR
jgi:carboxypeptidase C (cathepsin A)